MTNLTSKLASDMGNFNWFTFIYAVVQHKLSLLVNENNSKNDRKSK